MKFGEESETREFKTSTGETKEAMDDIVAILNKRGYGELYFGIKKNGEVVGQMVSEKTLRDVSWAIKDHISPTIIPTIERIVIDEKDCVRVLFSGDEQPYFAHGRAKTRSADETLPMPPADLKKYIRKQIGVLSKWDSEISDIKLNNINEELLKDYVQRGNEAGRISWKYKNVEDSLRRLDLCVEGKLLNTAQVMFSNRPRLDIHMAIFASERRLTFLDIKNVVGTIIELVDAAEAYVKSAMRWRIEFGHGMQRVEVPEVPIAAIREALLNSYAHRLWDTGQNNEVAIYKDRIEIYNPGVFPGNLTPEEFITETASPVQRNPLLAQVMYYSKDIEKFGTGLLRIHDACTKAGVKYEFKRQKLGFTVVFYRPKDLNLDPVTGQIIEGTQNGSTTSEVVEGVVEVVENVVESLTPAEREAYQLLKENPAYTTTEIGEKLGITQQAASKRLSNLQAKKAIKRKGSDTKGSWEII